MKYLLRTVMVLTVIAMLVMPCWAQLAGGMTGGLQQRYVEYAQISNDPLHKAVTSTGADTTASTYWNKIWVWNKPNGGITYFLYHDSLSTYVIADSAILQERHRWLLGGSYTSWAGVISTSSNGDTVYTSVPYSTSGKYYDLQLRCVMKENDSTGTPGSGIDVWGGAVFW